MILVPAPSVGIWNKRLVDRDDESGGDSTHRLTERWLDVQLELLLAGR